MGVGKVVTQSMPIRTQPQSLRVAHHYQPIALLRDYA